MRMSLFIDLGDSDRTSPIDDYVHDLRLGVKR